MAELIEGADIVAELVTYLTAELPELGQQVPVSSRVRQTGGVVIFDTGGPGFADRVIDRAQITVDSRAATETAAWRLASAARALVRALPGQHAGDAFVQRVDELARPALLPDSGYEGARYRWSVLIHTRARVR